MTHRTQDRGREKLDERADGCGKDEPVSEACAVSESCTAPQACTMLEACVVLENLMLAPTIGKLTLQAPQIAQAVLPGQFVHLRLPSQPEHVLRRPLGVYRREAKRGEIELVYQVVGAGTRHMPEMKPGAVTDIIGPVGRGWTLDKNLRTALLVAGGVGAVPLYLLAAHLAAYADVQMVMGAQSAGLLALRKDFEDLLGAERLHICTDDGSACFHGFTTDITSTLMAATRFDYIATCGPHAMQRVVARLAAEAKIPCEVSLEERMACGMGACLSCVVDTVFGKKRACVDGPVFKADEVIWDA